MVRQRHPLTGSTVFGGCLQIRFRELTWKAAACSPHSQTHSVPTEGTTTFTASAKRTEAGGFLTVAGDFVRRVEPPVPARRSADVHVEVDVVSQPVAALLVPHEYGLLPVLRPFTSVAGKEEQQGGKRMSEAAPFISARVIDFHVWAAVMARLRGKDGQ